MCYNKQKTTKSNANRGGDIVGGERGAGRAKETI